MEKSFGGSKWRICDFAWDTLTNCLKKFFVQNNLMLLQMMDDTRNLQVTDSIVRFHVSGSKGVHKIIIILMFLKFIGIIIRIFIVFSFLNVVKFQPFFDLSDSILS